MIHAAMLSKWHVHAVDYAREARENPDISIDVVWDEEPERGRPWANELNVPFESELSAVLTDPHIDAVIVDTPTNRHKDVIIQAAKHGKHIFTEKVLALTIQECDEILHAIEENNVHFMISLPRLSDPYYRCAQQALDQGLLGELTRVRCICAHDGAVQQRDQDRWLPDRFFDPIACGGGAFIDLGAHPIYLTNRLAGPAVAVTARLSSYQGLPVDDNSAAIVEYESGAIGILETGFVSGGRPFLLELHGTEGSLLADGSHVRIKSRRAESNEWMQQELPKKAPSPMQQWIDHIQEGKPSFIQYEDAWRLTQINQAAAVSHMEKRRVELANL